MTRSVFNHRRQPPSQTLLSADSFNRSNGAMGSTDGAGTKDPVAWTTQTGSWSISSNQASAGGASDNAVTVDLATADVDISVTLPVIANVTDGINFRFSTWSPLQFWTVTVQTGSWRLVKINGSATIVATGPTGVNGDTVRLVASGNSIKAYVNGSLFGSTTDSYLNTATKHGLYTKSTSTRWDNWQVYTP